MSITEPGIYAMAAEDYHADPCPEPSLSRSVALALVRQSPMHARYMHPRLSASNDPDAPSKIMDEGSALHDMLLSGGKSVMAMRAVYDAKHDKAGQPVTDFATKVAKEERDEIRGMGLIPVLHHRMGELIRCRTAVLHQLAQHQDGEGFTAPGRSEAVVVWREGDLWLRCMVDRLPDDTQLPPYDLKLTNMSAAPDGWERRLRSEYAFQCAFYRRGLAAVEGRPRPPMKFIAIESNPPHGVALMDCADSLRTIAEAEVERAIRTWGRCVRSGQWPGYPPFTAHVEAPTWMQMQADEAALRDEFVEENVF